jgi:hypothetical protein
MILGVQYFPVNSVRTIANRPQSLHHLLKRLAAIMIDQLPYILQNENPRSFGVNVIDTTIENDAPLVFETFPEPS